MLGQEELEAIDAYIDKKLDEMLTERLRPIQEEMAGVRRDVTELRHEVELLREQNRRIKMMVEAHLEDSYCDGDDPFGEGCPERGGMALHHQPHSLRQCGSGAAAFKKGDHLSGKFGKNE